MNAKLLLFCLIFVAAPGFGAQLHDIHPHVPHAPETVAERPLREDFQPYALVVVVNEVNELNDLSEQQVELIFSGDAGDWRTVSEVEHFTQVYAPAPGQERYRAIAPLVLDGRALGAQVMLHQEDEHTLARVAASPHAIGLVRYPFPQTEGVKILSVGGLGPMMPHYPYEVDYDLLYPETETYEDSEIHWSYAGSTGPEHWAELSPAFALCASGQRQSPIDLTDAKVQQEEVLDFHYEPSKLNLINNGHTIQQDYDPGSYVRYQDKVFKLAQFHFHSKSEHTVDGHYADLEMHLVHKADDGELLVVGMLFNKGAPSLFLNAFWSYLPEEEGEIYQSDKELNAATVLPNEHVFFSYSGSLTTPPCTEGVNWFVFAEPRTLSAEQLEVFRDLYSGNFRPLQLRNARPLLLLEP